MASPNHGQSREPPPPPLYSLHTDRPTAKCALLSTTAHVDQQKQILPLAHIARVQMYAYVGLVGAAAALVLLLRHQARRWRNPRCGGQLPPGSMGLPLVGETFQFFSSDASLDIPPFIRHRLARYAFVNGPENGLGFFLLFFY